MKYPTRSLSIFFGMSMLYPLLSFAQVAVKDQAINDNTSYNWTGLYAGLNAGIVKHSVNVTDINATTFYATVQEISNPNFTGGLQIGYRRQLTPTQVSGVYGIEFNADFSNASFHQVYGSPYALYEINAENELKAVYLLHLIGGIAVDKALLFLTAGLSWTSMSGSMTTLDGTPYFDSFNTNKTSFGTTVGGGVEYAVTKSLSARLKLDVITPNAYSVFDELENSFQISNHVVQTTIGVNYKFG